MEAEYMVGSCYILVRMGIIIKSLWALLREKRGFALRRHINS